MPAASPESIRAFLDAHGVSYRHLTHEPTPTSADSARARGEPIEIGAKAIVAKTDDVFRLLVMSAARRLHTPSVRSALGVRSVRFAGAEELASLTGLAPGSVPPFGEPILPLPLIVDRSIPALQRVAFNCASLTESIVMATSDYLRVARPQAVAALTEG